MHRFGDRQSGFSIMGTALIVLGIGVLAGASWVVYQHNKAALASAASNTAVTSQVSSAQPSTTTAPVATQTIVQIPELGIQITVPNAIKDLTYQTSTVTLRNGNQATLAMFSTRALTAADAKCGSAAMPLGSLERASGQYPTQTQDATNVLDYGQLVKQFPTFYIAAGYPQASCSFAPTAGSAMAATANNHAAAVDEATFEGAVATIQALN